MQKKSNLIRIAEVIALLCGIIGSCATLFTVQEVRKFLGLDNNANAQATSVGRAETQAAITLTLTAMATSENEPALAEAPYELLPSSQAFSSKFFDYYTQPGFLTKILTKDCAQSSTYGLQINYSFYGTGYGGLGFHWVDTSAGYLDVSRSNILAFSVKGARGGETFEIKLKDTSGWEAPVSSRAILQVTTDWKRVRIPLTDFRWVDLSSVEAVSFAFDQLHDSASICVDNIAFIQ